MVRINGLFSPTYKWGYIRVIGLSPTDPNQRDIQVVLDGPILHFHERDPPGLPGLLGVPGNSAGDLFGKVKT